MSVAAIIWDQISVSTKMSTGAREPCSDTNCLIFKVLKGRHRVKVILDPSDTYTVQLFKQGTVKNNYEVKLIEEHTDIYNDMLSETIYHMVNK